MIRLGDENLDTAEGPPLTDSFVSVLSEHENAGWDIAQLALARAHYFIPMLTRRNAEFGTVLETVQNGMPEPADSALDEFLQTLVDPSGMHEL